MGGPIGRSRRWAVALSAWLLVVPAALLLVRLALPSDDVLVVPPGGGASPTAVLVVPLGDVPGIHEGDELLAVNGVPASRVLTHAPATGVRAGDRLVYTVRSGGVVTDVPVTVRPHLDLAALLDANQPDAGIVSLAMLVLAAWLLRRRPDEPAAHAFLLFAAAWANNAVEGLAFPTVLDYWARPWAVVWADLGLAGYMVSGLATLLFAFAFPRPAPWFARRAWTAVALVPVLLCAAFAVSVALRGTRTSDVAVLDTVAEVLWQACSLGTLVVLGVRWFRLRRDVEARRRIQIVVLGLVTTLVLALAGKWLQVPDGTVGFGLVLLVFPASLAVAITRRDLYELDLALNRGLVAAGSGAVLLTLYLAVTAATASLARSQGPYTALPAAGVVAVAFAPVRAGIQRRVARRLFGTADDPQLVLHRLGVRLEASDDPESLVAAVVDTAVEALRLPYAAVELGSDGAWRVVQERGRRPERVETFDIAIGEEVVGRLVAAPRRDARALAPLDRRLLADLARHSGVAARVVALLTDLRAAQQRLLVAREEERHRIHRDLHDGVGPALVGLTLQLEVAADLAGDTDLGALTRRLHGEAARTTEDVRRMVRDLRPGELEELGLPAAVAAAAARLRSPHAPRFDLETPATLPVLAAEVEDAAYKICLEAMTNVIRHSGATRCTVRIGHDQDGLRIHVADDGSGVGEGAGAGTGLRSMRERAAAVGGEVTVSSSSGGGTLVSATLPVKGDHGT